jgi:putative tricarboxylic transport membrane protein
VSTARPPWPPLLGLVAAAALLISAHGLDRFGREGHLGPGFWPKAVLLALGMACLAKLAGDWRRRGRASRAAAAVPPVARGTLLAAIALIVLYVVATPLIGFPAATAAFIALFVILAGARRALTVTATAALGTVALLYVFVRLVYLPLPKGRGPFEALTVGLYRALGIF